MAGLSDVETVIRFAASGVGILTIIAPILLLSRIWGRRNSHPVDPPNRAGRVIVTTILLVLIGVALWRPLPFEVSENAGLALSLVGGLIYFPAVGLYLWGLQTLGRAFRASSAFGATLPSEHALIERGPYRILRHPMYLGVILAAVGALLIFRTSAMMVFFPTSFVVVLRARREEAALARRYGQAWQAYASCVPGWIPRFR